MRRGGQAVDGMMHGNLRGRKCGHRLGLLCEVLALRQQPGDDAVVVVLFHAHLRGNHAPLVVLDGRCGGSGRAGPSLWFACLVLHATILEPNLDLLFEQTQLLGHVRSGWSADVVVLEEGALQRDQLVARVGRARSLLGPLDLQLLLRLAIVMIKHLHGGNGGLLVVGRSEHAHVFVLEG